MLLALSDPNDEKLTARMKRFAGLYMNEDPEALNYDPVNKVIKSLWTGSKGPMLHGRLRMTGWAIPCPEASICSMVRTGVTSW